MSSFAHDHGSGSSGIASSRCLTPFSSIRLRTSVMEITRTVRRLCGRPFHMSRMVAEREARGNSMYMSGCEAVTPAGYSEDAGELPIDRVQIPSRSRDVGSRAVAKRAGYILEGTFATCTSTEASTSTCCCSRSFEARLRPSSSSWLAGGVGQTKRVKPSLTSPEAAVQRSIPRGPPIPGCSREACLRFGPDGHVPGRAVGGLIGAGC